MKQIKPFGSVLAALLVLVGVGVAQRVEAAGLASAPPLARSVIGPDVKVNHTDGPAYVNQGSPVIVTVQIAPGGFNGLQADWWCVAGSDMGWYYLNSSLSWVYNGATLKNIRPAYRGPLFNLQPLTVLNDANLPTGDYTVYFGVDVTADGVLHLDTVWSDAVAFAVQSVSGLNGRWRGISSTGQVESTLELNTVGESLWGYLYWPNNDTRDVYGAMIGGDQIVLNVEGGDFWRMTLSGGELRGTAQKFGGGTYALHFWR